MSFSSTPGTARPKLHLVTCSSTMRWQSLHQCEQNQNWVLSLLYKNHSVCTQRGKIIIYSQVLPHRKLHYFSLTQDYSCSSDACLEQKTLIRRQSINQCYWRQQKSNSRLKPNFRLQVQSSALAKKKVLHYSSRRRRQSKGQRRNLDSTLRSSRQDNCERLSYPFLAKGGQFINNYSKWLVSPNKQFCRIKSVSKIVGLDTDLSCQGSN